MTDSDHTARAYTEMRLQELSKGNRLPTWRELQDTERELLIRMFIAGASWMNRALREDAKAAQ